MPRRVKGYSQSLPTKDADSEGSDLEAGVGSDEDFSGHAMNDEALRTKAYDAPNIPDGGGRSVSNKKKGGISLKKIAIGLALVVAAVVASIFVIPMFMNGTAAAPDSAGGAAADATGSAPSSPYSAAASTSSVDEYATGSAPSSPYSAAASTSVDEYTQEEMAEEAEENAEYAQEEKAEEAEEKAEEADENADYDSAGGAAADATGSAPSSPYSAAASTSSVDEYATGSAPSSPYSAAASTSVDEYAQEEKAEEAEENAEYSQEEEGNAAEDTALTAAVAAETKLEAISTSEGKLKKDAIKVAVDEATTDDVDTAIADEKMKVKVRKHLSVGRERKEHVHESGMQEAPRSCPRG